MKIKQYVNDDRYEVSKCGKVFLKKHSIIRKNGIVMSYERKEKATNIKEHGYSYVTISKNNVSKSHLLHRMVAETFIPNPNNKPFVNHIDGNKQNNSVENLEWVTKKENQQHSEKNNMIRDRRGYGVDVFDDNGYVATFASISKASKYLNLDRVVIGRVVDKDVLLKGFLFRSVSTSRKA
jgi:hypothetical protein